MLTRLMDSIDCTDVDVMTVPDMYDNLYTTPDRLNQDQHCARGVG